MPVICHNGRFLDADAPVIAGSNPAFKWGEGLFETMKLVDGRILLAARHWARLHNGLDRLGMNAGALQVAVLENLLHELAARNQCEGAARLRLQVYREGAGLGFVAEASPLDPADLSWNERGWSIGLFPDARIAADTLSPLKRSNYLPYLLATRFAEEQGLDECLLLNAWERPADGARTNIFIVRRAVIQTPPLTEGGVAGVMRAHLLEWLHRQGQAVLETELTVADLLAADEIFLTNALKGIRWVGRFGQHAYRADVSMRLYEELQATF
ncbi:hypothetical protein EPD60_06690 [Flaviaesturariibacter flavus]|uniref:branched-chain-amino-acid transaminase n=1 Tax=Flaviaesturariibacter flavus TaxID=2502780 RepID=A0A4R1BKQ0_9BACT|nr:aminotransferase class IV [Flaviaesturariibacter flavus]TCJ17867.1 hypothetical protein EPD60_06690 [Flaviaesturariibacter flavus]